MTFVFKNITYLMEHTHVFMRLWEQRCIKKEGFPPYPSLSYPTLDTGEDFRKLNCYLKFLLKG